MKRVEVVFNIPVDKVFDYLPSRFIDRIYPGVRVKVPFGNQQKMGIVVSLREKEDGCKEPYKDILKVYDSFPIIPENLFPTADFLSTRYFSSLGQALFTMVGSFPTRYNIGFLAKSKDEPAYKEGFKQKFILLRKEKERFEYGKKIVEKFTDGSFVFLFPEIAQAESYYQQAKDFYGDRVVLFHGELKPREKISAWIRMLSEENIVLIGTRLAVFAPMKNISAFIINNGYDTSYREQQTPKYETSEVAEFRAYSMDVPLLFIDISLSVNRYFSITQKMITTEDSVYNRKTNNIYILPLNKKTADKKISFLSKDTVSLLEETILKGFKTAIIHNRRGILKILRCEKCEGRFSCEICDSSLVLSEDSKSLLCRFCKTAISFKKKCPLCGSRKVLEQQYGIEKIFNILRKEYPAVEISRVTSSTQADINSDFSILIGTKIVKKNIAVYPFRLIIFVSGESFLNTPDYRSEEHFFILVNEILASLKDPECKIIIQTRSPNLEIYRSLKEGNPDIFLSKELLVRKQLGYPPYREIVKIEIEARKTAVMNDRKDTLENYFKEKNIEVFYAGPSFPPVKKGKNVWKYLLRVGPDFNRQDIKKMAYETGVSVESNPERI